LTVGDIVNGISAAATILVFQPAVGVSIMITTCAFGGNVVSPFFTDGVNLSGMNWSTAGVNSANNSKIFLDNSLYLRFQALPAGEYSAFCGIQVQ